jgi:hypothetical protein
MPKNSCSKAISLGGKEEMGKIEGVPVPTDTEIIGINRRSVFSLSEARQLLPVINRMTKNAADKVQVLIAKIDAKSRAIDADREEIEIYESQASQIIQDWQTKVQKLGGLPKGIWIVDFDSGDGYFCWKFPEASIEHWHSYRDGFTKRRRLFTEEAEIRLATLPNSVKGEQSLNEVVDQK